MTISQHYKLHSRKSMKPYSRLLIIIVLATVMYQTLARYTSGSAINSSLDVATWNIRINNQQVTSATNTLQNTVKVISDTTGQNILAPGDTGYFDIEINPADTEVSLEYTLTINTSNLPTGTTLTSCELYQGDTTNSPTSINLLTNQSGQKYIEGDIQIGANGLRLTSSDKRIYRVHCTLNSGITANSNDNFYVTVNVELKQMIV